MVDADEIKRTIIELGKMSHGKPFDLSDVAKQLDLANWEEIMERIRLVAEVMAGQGLIQLKNDQVTYAGKSEMS
jgi:hypothetical protein